MFTTVIVSLAAAFLAAGFTSLLFIHYFRVTQPSSTDNGFFQSDFDFTGMGEDVFMPLDYYSDEEVLYMGDIGVKLKKGHRSRHGGNIALDTEEIMNGFLAEKKIPFERENNRKIIGVGFDPLPGQD